VRASSSSFLVITADDFGLREEVNEAVEHGNRTGVLTAASLMVGARAAADAVRRAKQLPHLRVGLHVVLADGLTVLPADQVPGLADQSGQMSAEMFMRGIRYFSLPSVRRQLKAEIRAQFTSFAATGLVLDHVNVHKHFHLHPTILSTLMEVGRDFGSPPIRVPREPAWFAGASGSLSGRLSCLLLEPWVRFMRHRIDIAGVRRNDQVFGIAASGAMHESRVLCALARLPSGISEIYLHPSTSAGSGNSADELATLLSPRVRDAITSAGIACGGYGEATAALRFVRS
jgi:hopanoid biosynthesis associated protein HpnK